MPLIDITGKSRQQVIKILNSFELPDTDPNDLDTDHIKEIILYEAPDLYEMSKIKPKNKTKKVIRVNRGGPIRKNKGGPIDARKIAKKYFKGTF